MVKLETRLKVEAAILELNYRPNTSARHLRSSRTYSVGVLICDSESAFLSDPFNSRLISGLSNYLSAHDYSLEIQGITPDRFESAKLLAKAGNDAICAILCGPKQMRRRHLEYVLRLAQPTVVFQEAPEPLSKDLCVIAQEDYEGGEAIGVHLAERGVRSVLFVRPALDWWAVEQRLKGLKQALETEGSIEFRTIQTAGEGFDAVFTAVRNELNSNRPDAIVGATDDIAVAALRACNDHGLSAPNDVLVAGFNDFDTWRYASPTLTTVTSQAYEMGMKAGEALLSRLARGSFSERNIRFPTRLHSAESTGEASNSRSAAASVTVQKAPRAGRSRKSLAK